MSAAVVLALALLAPQLTCAHTNSKDHWPDVQHFRKLLDQRYAVKSSISKFTGRTRRPCCQMPLSRCLPEHTSLDHMNIALILTPIVMCLYACVQSLGRLPGCRFRTATEPAAAAAASVQSTYWLYTLAPATQPLQSRSHSLTSAALALLMSTPAKLLYQ